MTSAQGAMLRHAIRPEDSPVWYVWVVADYHDFASGQHSYVGKLINAIKYPKGPVQSELIQQLRTVVKHSILQIQGFPESNRKFLKLDAVVAVPNNPPKKFSVPHFIADEVATTLGIPNRSSEVTKEAKTAQAKFESELNPGAFTADETLQGQIVLLVDDVLGSGNTLESVAVNLRKAGVKSVVGFCLAKTKVGMKSGN
jgi:predicted amidophosphoribosyltransferase